MSRPSYVNDAIGKPCAYCGVEMTKPRGRFVPTSATRDHIVPASFLSEGEKREPAKPSNMAVVCRRCNEDKADWLIDHWLARLIRDGDGRADRVADFIATTLKRLPKFAA